MVIQCEAAGGEQNVKDELCIHFPPRVSIYRELKVQLLLEGGESTPLQDVHFFRGFYVIFFFLYATN